MRVAANTPSVGETHTALAVSEGIRVKTLRDSRPKPCGVTIQILPWALQEDDEGDLWIGTYGGGLTMLKDGRFRTFTISDGLPDDVVMALDLPFLGLIDLKLKSISINEMGFTNEWRAATIRSTRRRNAGWYRRAVPACVQRKYELDE